MKKEKERTRRLNLTMLKKDHEEIETLVSEDKYISVSEFVREAIRKHLQGNKRMTQMEKMNDTLNKIDKDLEDIVKAI